MKRMRKLIGLLLTFAMVLSMATTVFAADTKHTITITNKEAGHTYEAYQVFAGDIEDGKLVNIEWGNGVNGTALLTALQEGTKFANCKDASDVADVLVTLTGEELDAFAKIVAEYLSATHEDSSEVRDEANEKSTYTIGVDGDGYYLVKDKDDSVMSDDAYTKYILKVVGNVEVEAKSDAPTLEKKIIEGEELVDANNGSVGDVVNYQITSKVPKMDGYESYYFAVNDTLSDGLTLNGEDEEAFEVIIGETTLDPETAYEVTIEGQSFKIVFNDFIKYKKQAGEAVVIKYSATINENAVIGSKGNPNEAYLEFSNNPNDEDAHGKTPDDIVITYVTGIELIKVDENGNSLRGAQFELTGEKVNKVKVITEDENGTYYKLKTGEYTDVAPTEETLDTYESETKYTIEWVTTTENVKVSAFVGDDGVLVFDGLAEGTYFIKEITAPEGYNMIDGDITVVISCSVPETVSAKADEATWKYSISGAVVKEETESADGRVQITVENKSGIVLPSTGGIGTTIFYVVGAILLLGSAVLIITRKRMSSK